MQEAAGSWETGRHQRRRDLTHQQEVVAPFQRCQAPQVSKIPIHAEQAVCYHQGSATCSFVSTVGTPCSEAQRMLAATGVSQQASHGTGP